MADKSGGDATNLGIQAGNSNADAASAAVGGLGAVEGLGGAAQAASQAASGVLQEQLQGASGGDGGDDNVNSNTNINIG
ncbi:MAG: hypothetical protein ACR2RB_01990 [Gammaproteobacteria bacterium]